MKGKSRKSGSKNSPIQQNIRNTPVTPAVKPEPQEEVILQFGENEITVAAISAKVKKDYEERGRTEGLKDIKIYVKPEDGRAYYVANGEVEGSVGLV